MRERQPDVETMTPKLPLAERWRWYHFYFLLAALDLFVILGSMALYHESLRSYEIALAELSAIGRRQSWVTDLQLALVELNAPGNDVFASRDVPAEKKRFEAAEARVRHLLGAEDREELELVGVEESLGEMVAHERQIFASFLALGGGEGSERAGLEAASDHMAAMDRAQARALRSLSRTDAVLRSRQAELLHGYETQLRNRQAAEGYFLTLVAIVLGGVFWFGRTLQRAHERLQEARRRAVEERQARLAAIGEVCASVAHGIRNPLAGISAAAQVAREDAPPGPLVSALDDILFEAERLNARTSGLLGFASPVRVSLGRIDVGRLLHETVRSIRGSNPEAQVTVECAAELDAWGDVNLLGAAIQEVVQNAIRATDGRGRVEIAARSSRDGMAEIDVTDHGSGIPAAAAKHLFELFFTTKPDGTGLGLATARKYLSAQGGTIELLSTGSTGSVFRLAVPQTRPETRR